MGNNRIFTKLKSFAPWIGLTALTLVLMIYFKLSEQGYSTLKSHGENLIDKYAGNLSPLFVNSELNEEDIFNFALYDKLPIDKKENRILKLESDLYGNDNYTISMQDTIPASNNLDHYKYRLGLSSREENDIDSILNGYKEDLYSSILLADRNSVAIDPKISLLHKAIGADIYKFALDKKSALETGKNNYNDLVTNRDKLIAGLRKDSENKPDDFIFITPDTVFSHKFKIDKKEFAENLDSFEAAKKEKEAPLPKTYKFLTQAKTDEVNKAITTASNVDFAFDAKSQKLTIPSTAFINESLPNYDSLKWSLDNLSEDLENFKFALSSSENGLKLMFGGDKGNVRENVEINFNFDKLGEFIAKTVSAATEASSADWEKFGSKMDSLSNTLSALEQDSTAFIQLKKVSEEIKKAKQNMKKQKNN